MPSNKRAKDILQTLQDTRPDAICYLVIKRGDGSEEIKPIHAIEPDPTNRVIFFVHEGDHHAEATDHIALPEEIIWPPAGGT
jgi:hypothetical protein